MGCRGEPPPSAELPPDERLVVLVPEHLRGSLDPRLNTRAWSGKIIKLVFEGVTHVDNPALAPEPALAERVEQPSPAVYEITLRANARFHDGSPVTAEDVAATWQSVRNPALKSPYRSMYERVERLEVLGPRRLRVTLKGPHATFLSDMSLGILPARLLGPEGQVTGDLIGAGPYRLHARQGEQEVVLSRFEDHHAGPAKTPWLVFRTIRDQNTRLLALLGGSADLVQNGVSPVLAAGLADRPGLKVEHTPGVAYTYLGFNLRVPALADRRVRQAMAHAINRDRLITHKLKGMGRPATGLLPEGHWAYNGDVPRYAYDPVRARALLAEAGQTGLKLALTTTTDKFRLNLARLIAADLNAAGFSVQVRAFELGTLLDDIKAGNFELVILQWPDPAEPHMYAWIFHSDRIPDAAHPNRGGNRGAYRNPEVDRLVEVGRTSGTRAGRRAAYGEIQRILATDLPYLSLWHEDVVTVRRSPVTGFAPLPNASFAGLRQASLKGAP